MTPSAETSRQSSRDGTFGSNLAATFHLEKSEQVVTAWPGDNLFAITRLQSDTGIPDRTTRVPSEAALHISVSILPVPLRAYELWIDGKAIDVPYIPSLRTSVMDLQSDPVCWVGTGFDYVHYHVPKAGLDDIARDHGVEPAGSYQFAICEHDIVLAQLTQYIFPLIGSRDWTGSLALDQFSLILGAHVLRAYALQSGFSDQAAFTRAFGRIVAIAPADGGVSSLPEVRRAGRQDDRKTSIPW